MKDEENLKNQEMDIKSGALELQTIECDATRRVYWETSQIDADSDSKHAIHQVDEQRGSPA